MTPSKITGFKVKIVEKSGRAVKNILHKSNPWVEEQCQREGCVPCETGEKKSCFQMSILYSTQCVPCQKAGITKKYLGETARSAHERGGEHISDGIKEKADSHIWKHQTAEHGGTKGNFAFRIQATYRSALKRQVAEAVVIRRQLDREGECSLLNSKGMYNRCSLPRLVVEQQGDRNKDQQERTQDVNEWPERSMKRCMPDSRGKERKRIKIDEESLKGENPRQQGIEKRKSVSVPNTELERELKRLRPEFDIDREVNFICNQERIGALTVENSKPKLLFDIFNPLKVKPKVQVQPSTKNNRKSSIPKSKKKAATLPNRKESLTQSAAQKDIRYFMKLIKKPPSCEDQSNTNLGGQRSGIEKVGKQIGNLDL